MGSLLSRELKQTKRLRIEDEAIANLLRTVAVIMREINAFLASEGLSGTQYNVLRILRGSPDGLRVGDVKERLVNQDPDVTRLLDRMGRRGWIARRADPADRRAKTVLITNAGLKKLGSLEPEIVALQAKLFRSFPQEKLSQLIELLEQLRESIHDA
jgi:MarR family transcriptional regulator, organic hydroperoxide resistance regulator